MTDVLGVEIPAAWSTVPLKELTSFLDRGSAPDYVDVGPVRVVGQSANQLGGLDWSRTRYHAFEGDAKATRGRLEPNDVLINSTGNGTLGRVGYFDGGPDELPCMADGHVTIARFSTAKMEPRFGYYLMRSKFFQEYLTEVLAVGATNQVELNRERLGRANLPLPPTREQCRIVSFLDAETRKLDKLTSTYRKLLELLRERRAAGASAEVVGAWHSGRRVSSLAWVDTLPVNWKEVRLSLVARMGSGHTPSRSHPEWWEDCVIPWVTTGEVSQVRDDRREVLFETRERISLLGLENSSAELHPRGTVVLCRTAASAGYSAVMGVDMATSQDIVTWTCGPLLDNFYLLWCLRVMRSDLLGRLAVGSTHKTIYVPDLQALRIPLPPIEVQREIVERIRRNNAGIDQLVDAVNEQLRILAEWRQAIVTAAVTGSIDMSTSVGREIVVGLV